MDATQIAAHMVSLNADSDRRHDDHEDSKGTHRSLGLNLRRSDTPKESEGREIPAMDTLPPFMLLPDKDANTEQVYALVDGVARFKGRIRFVETYKYGGREHGEGWLAEIPGHEDDPDHFTDRCNKGGKATAISRLLSS